MAAGFIIADRPGHGATSSGSSNAVLAAFAILVRPSNMAEELFQRHSVPPSAS